MTSTKNNQLVWFLGLALLAVLAIMFIAPEAIAGPKGNTTEILMSRQDTKNIGIDALAGNVVGNTSSTSVYVAYTISFAIGIIVFLIGLIGLYKQTKQDESQRKYFAPVAALFLGVAIAAFTLIFGLMSDTFGFGATIDDGVEEGINLQHNKNGAGIKANGSNSHW